MKNNELTDLALKSQEKKLKENVCKNIKEIEKVLKIYAGMGFFGTSVICEIDKLRELEKEVISKGLSVYAFVNEHNKGQLDIQWSY